MEVMLENQSPAVAAAEVLNLSFARLDSIPVYNLQMADNSPSVESDVKHFLKLNTKNVHTAGMQKLSSPRKATSSYSQSDAIP